MKQTPTKSIATLLHEDVFMSPKDTWEQTIKKRRIDIKEDEGSKSGKHASVYFASRAKPTPPSTPSATRTPLASLNPNTFFSPNVAVKTQHIQDPKDQMDRTYREAIILKEMTKLRMKHYCFNFVHLHDYFIAYDDSTEEEDSDASDSDDDNSSKKRKKTQKKKKKPKPKKPNDKKARLMSYVLEQADESFAEYLLKNGYRIPLYTYRCMLFQLFFALYIAQRECEFVHNDLHFKNILIKKLPEHVQCCTFYDDKRHWFTATNFLVKITDFGMSRIVLRGKGKQPPKVIYNTKNRITEWFNPSTDIEKIASEIGKIRIDYSDVSAEEAEAAKFEYSDLRRKMKSLGIEPKTLINHCFFDSLLSPPEHLADVANDQPQHPFPSKLAAHESSSLATIDSTASTVEHSTTTTAATTTTTEITTTTETTTTTTATATTATETTATETETATATATTTTETAPATTTTTVATSSKRVLHFAKFVIPDEMIEDQLNKSPFKRTQKRSRVDTNADPETSAALLIANSSREPSQECSVVLSEDEREAQTHFSLAFPSHLCPEKVRDAKTKTIDKLSPPKAKATSRVRKTVAKAKTTTTTAAVNKAVTVVATDTLSSQPSSPASSQCSGHSSEGESLSQQSSPSQPSQPQQDAAAAAKPVRKRRYLNKK